MQKTISIFLLVIYVLTNAGLYSSLHWCGEALQNMEVMTTEIASCCGEVLQANETAEEDSGCCHAEVKVWQAEDEQANEKFPSFDFLKIVALPAEIILWENPLFQPALLQNVAVTPQLARPPTLLKVPIYIKINVLRV
jgi:hypothetical protein